MWSWIEKLISVTIALSAIAVAAAVLHRTYSAGGSGEEDGPPKYEKAWKEALSIGTPVMGRNAAPIKIVTLFDLECPACASFHRNISKVAAKYPDEVQVVYVTFPLDYHRFSRSAARAGECANEVGSYSRWVDVVFAKQDSLGLKSWGSFAMEAGISDTARISACATAEAATPSIEHGLAFGKKIKLTATPTVMVNGWRFARPPSEQEIDSVIVELRGGSIRGD